MSRRQTPETALGLAIGAYNGPKELAAELHATRFEDRPDAGARWIAHCLDPDRREKFSLRDLTKIFKLAHDAGSHEGFAMFARLCGYSAEPIIATDAVIVELQERSVALTHEVAELQRDIQAIGELSPATLALMQHAHVKVGE